MLRIVGIIIVFLTVCYLLERLVEAILPVLFWSLGFAAAVGALTLIIWIFRKGNASVRIALACALVALGGYFVFDKVVGVPSEDLQRKSKDSGPWDVIPQVQIKPQDGDERSLQLKDYEAGKSTSDFSGVTLAVKEAKEEIYRKRFEQLKSIRRSQFEASWGRRREEFERECQKLIENEDMRRSLVARNAQDLHVGLESLAKQETRHAVVTDRLREFALKESPVLWETIQAMKAEIQIQDENIEKYKAAAKAANEVYKTKPDFIKSCGMRNQMVRSYRRVMEQLNTAYLMKKQYDATPAKSEYKRIMRQALDDGVAEAQKAGERYEELKKMRIDGE